MTNCKNCGAPLVNGKCGYCKTEYPTVYLTDEWDKQDSEFIRKMVMESILTPNECRKLVGLKE